MERKTLKIYKREHLKKGAAGRDRRMGRIPAIIYRQGEVSTPISVDEREFSKKFHTVSENTIINLQTEEKSWDVLVKDFQEDIVSGKILHIDFYEVVKGKTLRTRVPVHLDGTSKGVREGGLQEHLLHELEIECLPKDLPAEIRIDVSNLDVGNSIHVSDLTPPPGVRFLNSPEQGIVVITHHKVEKVVEEVAAAVAAEGEVKEETAEEKKGEA
ncbi:MAG: 50S ribosomal protein L25 [Spirochaetota bacterium]